MELSEYLAIRRAFSLARGEMASRVRLTFAEYTILSYLEEAEQPVLISRIAEYQKALRPTMTHRIKHLADIGYVERSRGVTDGRNVLCELSDEGRTFLEECAQRICLILREGKVLSRIRSQRVRSYTRAMGPHCFMAGDLVMLGTDCSPNGMATVSELVDMLGLLQPTVSMSVSALEAAGMVERRVPMARRGRSNAITLTEDGQRRVRELEDEIASIVVRRTRGGRA